MLNCTKIKGVRIIVVRENQGTQIIWFFKYAKIIGPKNEKSAKFNEGRVDDTSFK